MYRNEREAALNGDALVRGARTGRLVMQTRQEPNTMLVVKMVIGVLVFMAFLGLLERGFFH